MPSTSATSLHKVVALWSVLIFASFVIQIGKAASTQPVSLSESFDNEKAALRQLWPVLDFKKNVVRVYYGGRGSQIPWFPSL